jgi:hypothetical protein
MAGFGWIRRVSEWGECLVSSTSWVRGDIFTEGEQGLEGSVELAAEAEFGVIDQVEGSGVPGDGVVGSDCAFRI